MSAAVDDANAPLRRAIYALLIVVSCAAATGRILTLDSAKTPRQESTPFLSANDRSRWSTLRALVDEGTFALDDVIFDEKGNRRPAWYSIDLVVHRGWDGREHYYSSKPTLLTCILAVEYLVVKHTLGLTLAEAPLYVGRIILIVTNVSLLAVYLLALARFVERYGATDWGRIFVMACAAFGTFLSTFAVTLNNHLPAAVTGLIAVQLALRIWREPAARWRDYVLAGLLAALTAANELPALALLGLIGGALLLKSPLRTLLGFTPAALLVAAAALGANYYAHGTWKTPYAHRGDGPLVAAVEVDSSQAMLALTDAFERGDVPPAIRDALRSAGVRLTEDATVIVKRPGEYWALWDAKRQLRFAIKPNAPSAAEASSLQIHEWDNWYDYEGTYWTDENKQGVDRGEPSRWVYAFHCLIGHRGIYSLTPIWLLSLCGLWSLVRDPRWELRGLAACVALLMLVVLGFYIGQRPLEDRNYGGVSSGLRWMFWFIPLWLMTMQPAADRIAPRPAWRWFALALLAVSVISASYASLNPWSHSWIFDYWEYLEWIDYDGSTE